MTVVCLCFNVSFQVYGLIDFQKLSWEHLGIFGEMFRKVQHTSSSIKLLGLQWLEPSPTRVMQSGHQYTAHNMVSTQTHTQAHAQKGK